MECILLPKEAKNMVVTGGHFKLVPGHNWPSLVNIEWIVANLGLNDQ